MAIFGGNNHVMNPFYLIPHTPEPYFCDRKKETEDIVRFLDNGANVTLISPRRYGKTGLIYHVFDVLSARKRSPELFYVDIYECLLLVISTFMIG